jgi:hypothetical protein
VIGKILMGVLGFLLLLPGLCSVAFMVMMGGIGFASGGGGVLIWMLWLATFAIAWAGFRLLRKAWMH